MTFVGPIFHLLYTDIHESLKDKLWHNGCPFGDTLPEPGNDGKVFATHPYHFFLFFLNSRYEKISYAGPSLVWATLFFEDTWVFLGRPG
jgi:hypothetical protein